MCGRGCKIKVQVMCMRAVQNCSQGRSGRLGEGRTRIMWLSSQPGEPTRGCCSGNNDTWTMDDMMFMVRGVWKRGRGLGRGLRDVKAFSFDAGGRRKSGKTGLGKRCDGMRAADFTHPQSSHACLDSETRRLHYYRFPAFLLRRGWVREGARTDLQP